MNNDDLTRYPLATNPSANWVLTVDLPTPPLPDITNIICFTFDGILSTTFTDKS